MATNISQTNTIDLAIRQYVEFEAYVRIIIPIIFGLIFVLGLIGNSLVIFVILKHEQMRNTTNILILNLAIADLCFIIFCVPFTATGYVFTQWPFGTAWCKIVHYTIYVCAYASFYTLVLMSFDRYLAVVHPISSMSYRTKWNTLRIIIALWVIILGGHVPLLFQNDVISYEYNNELRTTCLNEETIFEPYSAKVFYGTFFVFGYAVPLSLICILYGFMLKRLLYGAVPGGSKRAEKIRSKKRVTKMVVIVVVIFALCWLPLQIVFMIKHFGMFNDSVTFVAIQMASNGLAYMNSCVNPILYSFLSEHFRRSFRKILCFGYSKYENRTVNMEMKERPTIPPT
ncbi:allatostatin-A receptor-like [Dreissena polymorpha]|nr:allatostatin-A receptor-like [Dreissena polymorpha]